MSTREHTGRQIERLKTLAAKYLRKETVWRLMGPNHKCHVNSLCGSSFHLCTIVKATRQQTVSTDKPESTEGPSQEPEAIRSSIKHSDSGNAKTRWARTAFF